jgi:transcriptional regulator with XRE-family HTH domain
MQDYSLNPYQVAIEKAKERHPESKSLYTQEKLAAVCGVDVGTIKNWCYGVSRPKDDKVTLLEEYLEYTDMRDHHLYYWEPFFRELYEGYLRAAIEEKPLAEAAVSLLNEFNDVKNVLDEFLHNVGKGKLTPAIKQELIELHAAILGALNAKEQV